MALRGVGFGGGPYDSFVGGGGGYNSGGFNSFGGGSPFGGSGLSGGPQDLFSIVQNLQQTIGDLRSAISGQGGFDQSGQTGFNSGDSFSQDSSGFASGSNDVSFLTGQQYSDDPALRNVQMAQEQQLLQIQNQQFAVQQQQQQQQQAALIQQLKDDDDDD